MAEHPAVRTVFAPYDSGHRGLRMGAGPWHLWDNGLPQALRSENRTTSTYVDVVPEADPPAEVAVSFELDRLVSEQVRGAHAEGEFPLVLSGNCNTSVGTLAGVGPEGLGVVWFDAHADFNTPETTTTGFTDGMGLAIAVGHCWKKMAEGVPGFSPVEEGNVVLAGARAVEPPEGERLGASGVAVVGADRIRREGLRALAVALDGLRERVSRVYVHLDLDVLDPAEVGPANEFAPQGGLTAEDLQTALGMVRKRLRVAAAGIASYDPSSDADGRVLAAALACVKILTAPDASRAR
jgi:arginase